MTVRVWTARISTRDPDALDVTRKTGVAAFAPSWKILGPMIAIRRAGRKASDEEWKEYARAYFGEMQINRRAQPAPWVDLLARERTVLTCYCTNPNRCHRTLLGRYLEKLGATFYGELDERDEVGAELFKFAMTLDDD